MPDRVSDIGQDHVLGVDESSAINADTKIRYGSAIDTLSCGHRTEQ